MGVGGGLERVCSFGGGLTIDCAFGIVGVEGSGDGVC